MHVNPYPHRQGGLPGPAVHGFRAAAGGGAAGVRAGGAHPRALYLRPPRPTYRQHGLPSDRSLHIDPDV